MRLAPLIFFALLCLTIRPGPASAGWSDAAQGLPLVEFYPNQQLGLNSIFEAAIQDSQGRLFFSGEKLLVYNGANWRTFPTSSSYGIKSLCFDPKGQLWVGGLNDLGYFDEDAEGAFHYHSLLDQVPEEHRQFNAIWQCSALDGKVLFFATAKVLSWDGTKFTVWSYPTAERLFPVVTETEAWFSHPETGLYRITADGPKLEYTKATLSTSYPMYLEKRGGQVLLLGNDGMYLAGHPDSPLSPPALAQFGLKGRVSGVVKRPGGGYFVSTVGAGLAVVAGNGTILSILSPGSGLPSNVLTAMLVDREGNLWCSSESGLVRIDASGSLSQFTEKNGLERVTVHKLINTETGFLALNDAAVHRLQIEPGRPAHFFSLPDLTGGYSTIASSGQNLLLGRFTSIEQYAEGHLSPVLFKASTHFYHLQASRSRAGEFYFFANKELGKLKHAETGQWESQTLATLPDYGSEIWEDPQGGLWCSTNVEGIIGIGPPGAQPKQYTDDLPAAGPHRYGAMAGRDEMLYFSSNGVCYRLDTRRGGRDRVGEVPGVTFVDLKFSTDGQRLYALFERTRAGGASQGGLGYFSLPGPGEPARWTELEAGGLPGIGLPRLLHVRPEEGADALWIGGSEAVLRVRPGELKPLLAPGRPSVHLLGDATATGTDHVPVFPFAGHHIALRIETPEVVGRKNLLFQTRFGAPDAPWSALTDRSGFEFNNLREGPYVFAVRSVNAAGQASPEAEFQFVVLPPWYRTNWAYGGGALLLLALGYGIIRLRERHVRNRNEVLQGIVTQRTAELTEANAAKDEFLAGISHEIRNPMNVVVGLSATINPAGLDEISRQHFSYLRHCAAHLAALLEDILDFSKVQAGVVALDPKPFNVAELVDSITAIASIESTRIGIPIEPAVSPSTPPWLVGDAVRLRQVLLNFVINALKYSERGTVRLTVWARPPVAQRAEVTFSVSDDGPGIPFAEQRRLFNRFERGEAARRSRVPGTGLGLALCRELVEKMGGRVWVISKPGQGATFNLEIFLPIAHGPLPAPALPALAPANRRALVVDDEEYNRVTLAALLAELGYTCEFAGEAREALALARTGNYDAVFLDYDLPGANGPEIARELRTLPQYPRAVPIVAATAFNTTDKRDLCFKAGMTAFLSKPITLEKIHSVLAAADRLQQVASPPPAPDEIGDPLALLRQMARSKGHPLSMELALFVRELQEEDTALATALRGRVSHATAKAAHRLTGRLAFIQAEQASVLTRLIEGAASVNNWTEADSAYARFLRELPALRERLMASDGGGAPAGSIR